MTKISNLYSLTNYITANTSGNIVISAPSSGYALDVTGMGRFTGAVTAANLYVPSSNEIRLYNTNSTNWGTIKGSTDATNGYITLTGGSGNGMTIANSGNVGIGTTSPSQKLDIYGRTRISNPSNSAQFLEVYTDGGSVYYNAQNNSIQNTAYQHIFFTDGASPVERMRITSGGFFKASNNGTYYGSTGAFHELRSDSGNSYSLVLQHTSSSLPYGMTIYYNNASPNSTNNEFIYAQDNSLSRFIVWSNGSVVNRTGSYGTISDIKFKENIVDATPKLEDLTKLKVRNFNLIGESTKQIGFIAQEFEEVFPNMVDVSTERGMDGETYKSIKTSVLVPMLVKAIQELSAKVTALENK